MKHGQAKNVLARSSLAGMLRARFYRRASLEKWASSEERVGLGYFVSDEDSRFPQRQKARQPC
jgi:hypothetical protein